MRIGIDAHMLGDCSGGNESYASGLFRAFEPDKKNEYILFMKPGVDDSPYRDKFTIVRFKSKNAFVRNFIEMTVLCLKYKLDILHTQYFIPFIRPCKTIVTIYDICFERFEGIFTKKEYLRNRTLIPYAARHACHVITISEFSKKEISEVYGIPTNKISVVYSAADEDFKQADVDEQTGHRIREKYDIGDSSFVICVGNLQPRKNIPRLVEAYNNYCKQRGSKDVVKLVIVGKKAWLYDESLKMAVGNSNIILTDYVSRQELIGLIKEADGLIYPSIYEGFGMPPLEAYECGTDVAVSDIPVMHEVMGENAIYFDPYDVEKITDAIVDLINKKNGGISHNDNSTPSFSWEKSAKKLESIYDAVETM